MKIVLAAKLERRIRLELIVTQVREDGILD